jgi:hypothetical protein
MQRNYGDTWLTRIRSTLFVIHALRSLMEIYVFDDLFPTLTFIIPSIAITHLRYIRQ